MVALAIAKLLATMLSSTSASSTMADIDHTGIAEALASDQECKQHRLPCTLSALQLKGFPSTEVLPFANGEGNNSMALLATGKASELQPEGQAEHIHGSCRVQGCGAFSHAHRCQCNYKCVKYDNCCRDFSITCASRMHGVAKGTCAGKISVRGFGGVHLLNARWNVPGESAGPVHVYGSHVKPSLKGRTYFTTNCNGGKYDPENYVSLQLLGKRFSYTSDVSGAGCGCNAAVYFTSMNKAKDVSKCGDYYCDAARVCGEACAEIDVQEANMFAYRATLHDSGDLVGWGAGYGGWAPHTHVWNNSEYGPHGTCITTARPYRVAVDFPAHAGGNLKEMRVSLSQQGSKCDITFAVQGYARMAGLSRFLHAGMTPVISYWNSANLTWMDGQDKQGVGPCRLKKGQFEGHSCAEQVKFYDFQLEDLQ